jgi:hypothetical protein
MKKLLLIVLLNAGNIRLNSQTVEDILGRNTYYYHLISIRNTPLFNAEEIKARGIRSCMIIEPMYKNRTDTLFIFNFDRTGNIEREIRFMNGYLSRRDTINGPRSEKRYYNRIDSTVSMMQGQKIVTKYYVWAFNPEIPEEDTSYIKRIVYDDKDRMVEFKMDGTQDYLHLTHCGTGITFDNKYRYNEKNDLVCYKDAYSREYATFSYHLRSRVVRVYDTLTNRLKRKFTVRITNTDKEIIEKDDLITSLTRVDKGSKLFSFFSTRQDCKDCVASGYLLLYEYPDSPSPKENLLVSK